MYSFFEFLKNISRFKFHEIVIILILIIFILKKSKE